MDAGCLGATCSDLKTQSVEEAGKCKVPERVKEDVDGCKFPSLFLCAPCDLVTPITPLHKSTQVVTFSNKA